ncbi:MAG: NifU-like domain protein [Ignavibacteriae bacterium]|nr:MAG: NifU-like domain protein [Ignavibacteriota bacterium]
MLSILENNPDIKKKVEDALETCRQFLNQDGGDVELIDIENDGTVRIRYHGTCKMCPLSLMTLRGGIERTILNAVPSVRRVELVN